MCAHLWCTIKRSLVIIIHKINKIFTISQKCMAQILEMPSCSASFEPFLKHSLTYRVNMPIFGHTPIIRSLSHWLIVFFLPTFTKFQWRFIQKLHRWCTLKRIIDGPNIFLYPITGWRNVWVTPWKALKISLKSKLSHLLRYHNLLESIEGCQYCRFIPYFLCYLTCTLYKMYTPIYVSLIGCSSPLVPGWPNIGIGDIKIRLYSVSGFRFIIFNEPLVKSFEENIFW